MTLPASLIASVAALLLTGCGRERAEPGVDDPPKAAPERPPEFDVDDDLDGLRVNLRTVRDRPAVGASDGAPDAASAAPAPPEPLGSAAVDALLDRAPELVTTPDDEVPFRVRKGSPPPPLSGDDVHASFPPRRDDAPDVAAGPVEVLRYAPEGEVPLAPRVSVTFDQPMVALTTVDEAAATVPVRLEPQPDGEWRWLGTRTLVFDPDERLPMATEYTVTVPSGISSVAGSELADDASFSFATPPPSVRDSWPHRSGSQPLQPVIGLVFDQAVDAEAVLEHVSLSGGHAVRMATEAEREEQGLLQWHADAASEQVVLMVPAEPLPPATSFTLTVPPGLVGAEGPRPSTEPHRVSFATYAPLEVTDHHCSWRDECPPTSALYVEMNNLLDPDQPLDNVVVEPEVPGLSVVARGQNIMLTGRFSARTRYTVQLPAELTDTFGQTLGRDEDLRFSVGPAEPTFDATGGSFVVLDPNGGGTWPVFTTNHDKLSATIHAVDPEDWTEWVAFRDRYRYDDNRPKRPPGTKVIDETIAIDHTPDELTETALDLSPHLDEGYGQFVAVVQPRPQARDRWRRRYELAWVQVTRLGLHSFIDGDEVLTWVSDLATGEPLGGVEVSLQPSGETARTGDDGLVRLPLSAEGDQLVVARRGPDRALLPASPEYGSRRWHLASTDADLRWYVADDRGLYKPGESARVKGWLRHATVGPEGDLALPDDLDTRVVTWRLVGSRGNELAKGSEAVSEQGGFDLTLEIPGDANLGDAWLELDSEGSSHRHRIPIQEFRRPEVEVTAEADRDRFVLGEEATVEVSARYFAGGPLPDSVVRWTVHASDAGFRPPGHQGYTFGTWAPRWWGGRGGPAPAQQQEEGQGPWTLQARTDSQGTHRLGVHVEAMGPPRARTLRVEGQVEDVNRQAWTGSDTVVVHPAAAAVGLRTERSFVDPDDPIEVDLVVTDLDGEVLPDRTVEAVLEKVAGWWADTEPEELDDCEATSDAEGHAHCTFTVAAGGSYRVRAQTHDDLGRTTSSELRVWVSGAERAPSRKVELEKVTLIPETDELAPGDTARVLVSAPFAPSEAVITLRRSGLLSTERRRIEGHSTTLEIPITNAHTPDLTVQVDLVGQAARTDDDGNVLEDKPERVAHATGALTLQVPPSRRTLGVEVRPAADALAPGRDTELTVAVTDADGRPVEGAEVAVVVVDEAVLSLTGYQLPDPLAVFYAARGAGVSDLRLRQWVALADPERAQAVDELQAMPAGGGGLGLRGNSAPMAPPPPAEVRVARTRSSGELAEREEASNAGLLGGLRAEADKSALRDTFAAKITPMDSTVASVEVREDFGATALFAPAVRTGAGGRAVVPFTLPDSLTRYRIMAVAVDGGRSFGSDEASITARLPLMVRPSLPRFLNSGDQAELPVVLQNQTDESFEVSVAMRVTNLALIDALTPTLQPAGDPRGGWRVTVPANDRVEVRFPATTASAGTAQVQVVAAAGPHQDAARLELPVYTPATSEAFATTGSLTDAGLQLPVDVPADVWREYGGLEVTTSSTQLQALTDAVLYLQSYPFECNEQVASRVLSIAALHDVLAAFETDELPSPEELRAGVQDDLSRLARRQHPNGGFAFWRRGDRPWPYLSIHVAMALAEARQAGYVVDEQTWQASRRHLERIERHIPSFYSEESRRYLRAFALDVRRRMGDADPREARRLLGEVSLDDHGIEVLGFLLPTLHEAGHGGDVERIQRHLGNRVTETTAGAHFVTSYANGEHVLLHSSRRADAIVLRALLEVAPDDELLDKVTRDLLAHRTRGRWASTQENAFVLLALRHYFEVREKETPDFVAKVWLGDGLVGEHPFRGRTTERFHVDVPLTALDDTQTLTLLRDGAQGRMFYRLGLRYAPESLELEPADRGFVVQRTYEAVDDAGDVRRDPDGTWHIRAGATVRVRLSMVADSRRYHVALVDPLPAGLEASNPVLATTGTLPEDPTADSRGGFWWWTRTWYEHENLRDERVEAFTSLLWPGVHEYSYIARATTPGRFVVPPAKAEEMYSPETFGRSATERVVVE